MRAICRKCHLDANELTEDFISKTSEETQNAYEHEFDFLFGDEKFVACPSERKGWWESNYPKDWGVPEDCPHKKKHKKEKGK